MPTTQLKEFEVGTSHKSAVLLANRFLVEQKNAGGENVIPLFQKLDEIRFDHCQTHGEYPLNVFEGGSLRWFPDVGCPHCFRQKQTEKLLTASNIPKRFLACSFENYRVESERQKDVLESVRAYADNFAAHRESGAGLILCGKVGTGKNHLATAVFRQVMSAGFSALFVKASEILNENWAKDFAGRAAWIKKMAAIDLLMIDEFGRASETEGAKNVFFSLIDARYEAQLPTLLTTNLDKKGLIACLGEAGFDRLTQGNGLRLTLNWESYRGRV